MKNPRIKSLWRFLIISLAVSVSLLVSSTVSFAVLDGPSQISSSTADCRLAHNPDDCYRQQNQQQWTTYTPALPVLPPISTQTLGLEGPFSADLRYDDALSWIFGLKYLHIFGESAGIATKLTGGANELRANITAGYVITKDQQVKLTYEYLTQNLPFDFASGAINEWVRQHSLGVAYQYLIRNEIVHSLELSGYATRAKSRDLENLAFNQQIINGDRGYLYDVNYRRIAGGKEDNVLASVNLFPFANDRTTLILGGGYSSISYDTVYENNQSATRPSYKAEISHLLSRKAKLGVGTTGTAASVEHSIGLSHLLPKKFEASLRGEYTTGLNTLGNNRSITLGLTYPAAENYSLASFSATEELKNWIDKPVVYATRVLAIKDEMVQRYEFSTANLTLSDQSKRFGELLDAVPSASAFKFTDPNIIVNYTVTTIKESAVAETKSDDGRDFTQELHLELVSDGQNQAILRSQDGIPAVDKHGNSTLGVYGITITATGIAEGLTPITLTNTFKLILGGGAPIWDANALPDGHMGFPYPSSPSALHSSSTASLSDEVDLTAKLTLQGMDTAVDITIEDTTDCLHPTWVEIHPCSAPKQGHQCLFGSTNSIPTPIPNDQDIHNFCVNLKATGSPSQETTQITFKSNIAQQKPEWKSSPPNTPYLKLDGTSPAVDLRNAYIDSPDSNLNLGFDFQDGFDNNPWLLDKGLGTLSLTPDSLGLGSHDVLLVATNSTSYGGATQRVPMTVIVNADYLPQLTGVITLAKRAESQVPYSQNLQNLQGDSSAALLRTLNGTIPITDDTYTFEVVGGDPGWFIDDADKVTLKNNAPVLTATGNATVILKAFSLKAARFAEGGNAGGTPPVYEQIITIPVDPNPELTVEWTGISQLPIPGTIGKPYAQNLQALQETPDALLKTFNSASGTSPIKDTYTFEVVSQGSDPNWYIDTDGITLKKTSPTAVGTADVILKATSKQAGGKNATGGNGTETTQQIIHITINSDTSLIPEWTSTADSLPLVNPTGTLYTENLNSLSSGVFLLTTPGRSSDKFEFEFAQTPPSGWQLLDDPMGMKSSILTGPITPNLDITIQLKAKSRDADKYAIQGNVSSEVQEFHLKALSFPQFVTNTTTRPLKFDTTGDGYELGDNKDGLFLNDLLVNSGDFTNLTFEFVDGTSEGLESESPDHIWRIRTSRLLRNQIKPVEAAENGTVDAGHVGQTIAIPQIKVCTTDGAPQTPPRCSYSASNTINVPVVGEPLMTYQYAPNPPSPLVIVSVTSDGQGGRGLLKQNIGFIQPDPKMLRRTAGRPGAPEVLNDPDAQTFFYPPSDLSHRGYITYDAGNKNIDHFDGPYTDEFGWLAQNVETGYLIAGSRANDFTKMDGNLINLPPITTNKLILVPSKGSINSGFTPGNRGANVGVGINNRTTRICDEPLTNSTLTALAFDLPQISPTDTRNYSLVRANITPTTPYVGVCVGTSASGGFLPVPALDTQARACSVNNVDTWDASNIMGSNPSNLPNSACRSNGGGTYTNPSLGGSLGKGGNYTLFALRTDMNSGVAYPVNPDIPVTYVAPNMTGRGARKTALMFGTSADYDTTDYAGFPMVELK
jgi:hypothetical protein